MTSALGIDLGTTFSVAAVVGEAGVPAVVPNAEGDAATASAVLLDGDTAVVGAEAVKAAVSEPESVVQLVKRHIGSQWTYDYGGVSFGPEHISSLILRKINQDARRLTGAGRQVAITVPAYFNETMRLATRRAGELAGLEVLGLLAEPTAAALAYGFQRRPVGATGIVVDLGGGTFDVTVLDYDGSDLVVRAAGGDAYLGGANFDKIIFDRFVSDFEQAHGIDINDPDDLSLDELTQVSQVWLAAANGAKHTLTSRDRATLTLYAAGLSQRVEISREQFEAESRVLLDEMSEKMLQVVHAAGKQPDDIDLVLAVGGSTRIPAVRSRIAHLFRARIEESIRPDEVVALGASLYAAQRQLEVGNVPQVSKETLHYLEATTLHDVAAHSLGISVQDRHTSTANAVAVEILLARNTPLPNRVERTFVTTRDHDSAIVVPIMEGEERDVELCRRVGELRIDGLPGDRPAGQPVTVSMTLDRDGILSVSATDLATGRAAETRIDRDVVVPVAGREYARPSDSTTPANPADTAVQGLRVR